MNFFSMHLINFIFYSQNFEVDRIDFVRVCHLAFELSVYRSSFFGKYDIFVEKMSKRGCRNSEVERSRKNQRMDRIYPNFAASIEVFERS